MNQTMLNNLLLTVLIICVLFVSISNEIVNNEKINNLLNRLTEGSVNTFLLLSIIGLVLTEDSKIGLLLSIIYLVILIRTNRNINESFRAGPSPLNCKTYGDSRKKTGSAFYPLHDQNPDDIAC
jgi:hypothetical protein